MAQLLDPLHRRLGTKSLICAKRCRPITIGSPVHEKLPFISIRFAKLEIRKIAKHSSQPRAARLFALPKSFIKTNLAVTSLE
jgi:hypothetical protein